jgi:hypothetical protein
LAISGIAGIALAFWLQRLLPIVTGLRDLGIEIRGVERPVLAFALGLSVLTGVLFGTGTGAARLVADAGGQPCAGLARHGREIGHAASARAGCRQVAVSRCC